jgi:SAM-dependent methyltransferase
MNDTQTIVANLQMPAPDWQRWLHRWDEQQTGYLPDREKRFTAMLDALEALMPVEFVALDLCCGPGSISQRLLTRFPQARCIAADLDPVLLAMGQAVLGNWQGRLRWVEVNLIETPNLAEVIGETQVDAVLSTTALHWLPVETLVLVYRQLGQLVRSGGVLLNGDHINFGPHMAAFQQVAEHVKKRQQEDTFEKQGVENWEQWWAALAAEPDMTALLEERKRRFTWGPEKLIAPIVDIHEAALRDAGFREVGVIWQHMDNRVMMAVR